MSLVVPLAIEEMRETSSTDMHKLVEDGRDDSRVLNFEVEAGLSREPKDLFHHELGRFFEDRVDDRVNQS